MNKRKNKQKGPGIIARNKQVWHDFDVLETFEAGIVLLGTEVKTLRQGRANLSDSYARIEDHEVFVLNLDIPVYSHGSVHNHEPKRKRKLLLHRREIRRLMAKVLERGFTLVPTKLYFKRGFAKLEIALAKGKSKTDKRQDIKRREHEREMQRFA